MIVVGSSGQFDAKYFNVRCVPKAEVDLGFLKVCYRESCRSDFNTQRRLSALSGLP
jgi:hypothetical protein